MTVPQRILLHVAAGAAVVLAVATGLTYWLVYSAARDRDLQHLDIYVAERARREEQTFLHVQGNLALVRGQFLKLMEEPAPVDYEAQWNEQFRLFPDGAWRSREQFSDGRKYATMWAHRDVNFTPEMKVQVLRAQDISNQLLPAWVDSFPSVYFVFPGWLNIGFDPRIANWVWDTPADYSAADLEWFQLALPRDGQPKTDFSWTGVIEEPTTKFPIVSVYIPIEKDGKFLGSIGHDIYVKRMMEETTRSELPGTMHVIFRPDGRLIAHPTKLRQILDSGGRLSMQDSGEPVLTSLYRLVQSRTERRFSGFDESTGAYYSVAQLAGPNWYFLTTVPRAQLQQQAARSAQWVLWSGLFSLALVLSFLGVILRRQIARPLIELTRATKQMAGGDHAARADVSRTDEFGALAGSFNDMAQRVASRESELRQLNQNLEERVTLRTAELTEANRQLDAGREEALLLLARERELRELKDDFVSLVSHEFRTPLEVIMSSVDNLDRYHDRLPPEKRAQLLHTINKSVRRMSGMMEDVLVLGRLEAGRTEFKPAPLDLAVLSRRVADEMESATNRRCPVQLAVNVGEGEALADEALVRHIVTNLLSNAVKYSPAEQPVELAMQREGRDVVIRVSDRGCGIPEADRKRMFQAFHRGSNVRQIPGTGLGLLIVQRCVAAHGGTIAFESTEGQGTTFTVRLPVFPSAGI